MNFRMLRQCLVTVAVASSLIAVAGAVAGDKEKSSAGPSMKQPDLPSFTPQREAVALGFVEQHHAELATVIGRLKSVSRQQYEQAVCELFVQADKLTRIKASDEQLYELMLDAWKLQSRIEVLAARLSYARQGDEALEQELETLIRERIDYERRIVEHRRKRLLESLAQLEESLKWFDDNSERIAQRRFQILLRSAKRGKGQK